MGNRALLFAGGAARSVLVVFRLAADDLLIALADCAPATRASVRGINHSMAHDVEVGVVWERR